MRDSLGSESFFGLAQVVPRNPANRSKCSVAGRETISHQAKTIKKNHNGNPPKRGRNNLLCTVAGEAAHQHMIKGRNC